MPDGGSKDSPKGGFGRLFSEARRRRVIRTLVLYAGLSVAVVEAADIFTDPLALPEGTVRLLAILAICLLPLVVALAWVYDITPDGADPGIAAGSTAGTGATGWGGHAVVLGAAVLSVGGAILLWSRGPAPARPAAGPDRLPAASVAVLPLEARDPELGTLATSLHGRLIDGLSQAGLGVPEPATERLRVISRAGVLPFAGRDVSPDSIGRALGVGTLVDGSVERAGERVEVRLRLIDPATLEQMGATVAGARAGDHVALLDAVADSATRLLREELGGIVRARVRLLETESREAFEHVIWADEARDDFRAAFEAGDLERARRALAERDSLLAEAERLDPGWVEPVVQRAWQRAVSRPLLLAAGQRREEELASIYREGIDHAQRAAELEPDHPDVLHVRGTLRALLAGLEVPRAQELREEAEADLRAAVRRSARPADALRRLSELLADRGRFEEAYQYGRRSYEEDPYLEGQDYALLRLFEHSFRLDRDEEAADWCRRGFERNPLPYFWDCRLLLQAWSETVEPRPDTAWALAERELEAYPAPLRPRLEPRLHALVAAVLARAGAEARGAPRAELRDSARAVLARAWARDDGTTGMLLVAAGTHAFLGDDEIALGLVRRVREEHPDLAPRLPISPELRALRDHPRFGQVVGGGEAAEGDASSGGGETR